MYLGFTFLVHANHIFRLHKEIKDFYEYVKPRPFEDFIRAKLVEDLQIRVGKQYRGGDIRTFGSFPAGLYLPTADMDLVCVSESYLSGGPKMFGLDKRDIRNFGQWLKRQQLVMSDSLDFVLGARVPLVKYVDNVTGLKIDISFENSTGLIANKTFQDWKAEYPAMPILVTLIKHFLAMRGLNEPVNGGIGGFSVTCLVVHLLKSMPQVESRSMIPEHHLGELLMEFFDLYGNNLNTALTAIQFDPPRYIPKVSQYLCLKTFADRVTRTSYPSRTPRMLVRRNSVLSIPTIPITIFQAVPAIPKRLEKPSLKLSKHSRNAWPNCSIHRIVKSKAS